MRDEDKDKVVVLESGKHSYEAPKLEKIKYVTLEK
jgi:hypothetical protein